MGGYVKCHYTVENGDDCIIERWSAPDGGELLGTITVEDHVSCTSMGGNGPFYRIRNVKGEGMGWEE